MKSFAKFAVVGVSSVILFKLFATIFIPLFGLVLGLLATTVKLALWAAIAFFVYELLRRKKSETPDVEVGP